MARIHVAAALLGMVVLCGLAQAQDAAQAQPQPNPAEIDQLYAALDKDGDGKVSKEEFAVIFLASDKDNNQLLDANEFPPETIQVLDKDAKGSININEFMQIFDVLDTSKDGFIQRGEFQPPMGTRKLLTVRPNYSWISQAVS